MRLQAGHGAAGVGSLLLLLLLLSEGAVSLGDTYDDDADDEGSFALSAAGNEVRSFDGTGDGDSCCVFLLILLECRVEGCD